MCERQRDVGCFHHHHCCCCCCCCFHYVQALTTLTALLTFLSFCLSLSLSLCHSLTLSLSLSLFRSPQRRAASSLTAGLRDDDAGVYVKPRRLPDLSLSLSLSLSPPPPLFPPLASLTRLLAAGWLRGGAWLMLGLLKGQHTFPPSPAPAPLYSVIPLRLHRTAETSVSKTMSFSTCISLSLSLCINLSIHPFLSLYPEYIFMCTVFIV